MTATAPNAAPLFGFRGLPLAFVIAVVLCWPMFLTGEVFVFTDSGAYLRAGQAIWQVVSDLFGQGQSGEAGAPGGPAVAGVEDAILKADGGPKFARSIVYAAFAYAVWSLASVVWIPILQGMAVILTLFALVDREALASPRLLAGGAVLVAALTTLPWHTVYLMPDILGAIPLIYGAVLLGGFDRLGAGQKTALTLLTALAGACHYGNMPLIAGICLVCFAVRLTSRRLTRALLLSMTVAVLFAPGVNLAASAVTLKAPTATPLRLPILLARSLRDGPAHWYLETRCDSAQFAMCEAFGDRVPDTLRGFLWDDDGIRSLTPEMMARIRAEELPLLWQVFLTYPVAQSASLTGNTLRQLLCAGTGEIWVSAGFEGDFVRQSPEGTLGIALLRAYDRITPVVALLCVLMLAGLALSGRLSRQQRRILAILAVGVVGNAFIFGGLSAPVDRYQSRLIWLLPAILVIFAAQIRSREHGRRLGSQTDVS